MNKHGRLCKAGEALLLNPPTTGTNFKRDRPKSSNPQTWLPFRFPPAQTGLKRCRETSHPPGTARHAMSCWCRAQPQSPLDALQPVTFLWSIGFGDGTSFWWPKCFAGARANKATTQTHNSDSGCTCQDCLDKQNCDLHYSWQMRCPALLEHACKDST